MSAACSTNMTSCTDCGVLHEAYALDGLICLNDSMFRLKPKMECPHETKIARR
jgi:hypothetical protein